MSVILIPCMYVQCACVYVSHELSASLRLAELQESRTHTAKANFTQARVRASLSRGFMGAGNAIQVVCDFWYIARSIFSNIYSVANRHKTALRGNV